MLSRSLFAALLLVLSDWCSAYADPMAAPSPPRAPSEPGTLGIVPWGFYANLLHNDSITHSDKLLTQAARMGVLGRKNSISTYNIDLAWRVMNPSFKPKFGEAPNDEVIGRFADWLELSIAQARLANRGDWQLQFTWHFGASHFGDKGAQRFQRAVHKAIGTSADHLTFVDQPDGLYGHGGFEGGLILQPLPVSRSALFYSGAGVRTSQIMDEVYTRLLYIQPLFADDQYRLAAEIKAARQIESRFLGPVKKMRWEYSVGLNIDDIYVPTVSYVSDYLVGDDVGQLYVDFLNFSVPF